MPVSTSSMPVRVLSLDGGGVRGLAELVMLEKLFEKINFLRGRAKLSKKEPWEIFDIIGGTSTGGLIAIMLGRLRMSIADCIEAYMCLSKQSFQKRNFLERAVKGELSPVKPHFHTVKLTAAIQSITGLDRLLKEDESTEQCQVFVVAHKEQSSRATTFRSYYNIAKANDLFETLTIWEACRATSAATTFFEPVMIGGSRYSDGALQYNNPVRIASSEAREMFPRRKLHIVSLGTGTSAPKEFDPGLTSIATQLADLITETEKEARDFARGWDDSYGTYHRFSPPFLGKIGLEEADKLEDIRRFAVDYVDETEAGRNLVDCAVRLVEPSGESLPDDLQEQRIVNDDETLMQRLRDLPSCI